MKIKKLYDDAIVPTRGTQYSAGLDLYAYDNVGEISPQQCRKIGVGIVTAIPKGYVGLIFVRSGTAVKKGLRPINCVGVIDSDYRGELIVPLYNDSNTTQTVSKGERIAQLVVVPYLDIEPLIVDELDDTERGCGGFGSTG